MALSECFARRRIWIRAGLLLGAATAAVILTSGHAHAATLNGGPLSAPVVIPAPVTSAISPVVAVTSHVVEPVVARVVEPLVTPLVTTVANVVKPADVIAPVSQVALPTLTPASIDRIPSDALDVRTADVPTVDVPTVDVPTAFVPTVDVPTEESSSAYRAPMAALSDTLAPRPGLPPSPMSPAMPAGGDVVTSVARDLPTAAVREAGRAGATLTSSRLVRRVRTDGRSAFIVYVVEWPG